MIYHACITPGRYANRNRKRFRKKAPEQAPDFMATGSGGRIIAMMRRMTSPIDIVADEEKESVEMSCRCAL